MNSIKFPKWQKPLFIEQFSKFNCLSYVCIYQRQGKIVYSNVNELYIYIRVLRFQMTSRGDMEDHICSQKLLKAPFEIFAVNELHLFFEIDKFKIYFLKKLYKCLIYHNFSVFRSTYTLRIFACKCDPAYYPIKGVTYATPCKYICI